MFQDIFRGNNASKGLGAPKSLLRAIIGYSPANIIPALMAIATIVVFTRLLPPRELGYYAFAQACFSFGQVVAFSSLQLSVTRFFTTDPLAQRHWIASAYRGYLAYAAVTAAIFAIIILLSVSDPELRQILWVAIPALLARGLVMVNLGIHRRLQNVGRYNMVECGQPVIAFVVSVLLVGATGMGAVALLWGLLAAAALAVLIDLPLLIKAFSAPDRVMMGDMARYGTPLAVTYALSAFSAYADRGFLLGFIGAAAVGVYGIAYNLVDRATSLIFISVNIGAFPMALMALDAEGPEAARSQMRRTAMVLLTLAVPAAAGMACTAHSIAAVLVGAQYREAVGTIMPWLALSLFIRGLSVHFFEHAFHLGRKTKMSLAALVPVAVLNFALNAVLIPQDGIRGGADRGHPDAGRRHRLEHRDRPACLPARISLRTRSESARRHAADVRHRALSAHQPWPDRAHCQNRGRSRRIYPSRIGVGSIAAAEESDSVLKRAQCPEARHDLLFHHLFGQRAGKAVAHPSRAVYDEGLRHAVNAEIDSGAATRIHADPCIGIAQRRQILLRIGGWVLVVDAVDRHAHDLREFRQHRSLGAARRAP